MQATIDPTVVCAFDDREQAEAAVDELTHTGFDPADVHFALRGDDVARGGTVTDAVGTRDKFGLRRGMIFGSLFGGLTGVLLATAVLDRFTDLAGNFLAIFVGFGAAGTVVGGLLGAFIGLFNSEREAKFTQEHFADGKAIVTVHAHDRLMAARAILLGHGGHDVHSELTDPLKDAP